MLEVMMNRVGRGVRTVARKVENLVVPSDSCLRSVRISKSLDKDVFEHFKNISHELEKVAEKNNLSLSIASVKDPKKFAVKIDKISSFVVNQTGVMDSMLIERCGEPLAPIVIPVEKRALSRVLEFDSSNKGQVSQNVYLALHQAAKR